MGFISLFKRGTAKAKRISAETKEIKGRRKKGGKRERKIGIFGHTRSGKTVFFTMLWHKTHGRRDFSLETDDYQTRQDMSGYYDLLASGKWPPPTATERKYRFTAVIDSTIRYPFESQDYRGESVSIDREVEAGKEFLEYFESCDCVFILVDAEDLVFKGEDAALRRRKKIDSFELMLAQLVEGTRNRLKIPVAIVITKSDLLDGFRGEGQVVLVGDDIRYSRYKGYESFVSAVLQQEHVSKHLPWRDQVEEVLLLLKPLVDYCLTKSPDLQIFFISSTGGVEHATDEDGNPITLPPRELRPIGLEKPFVWSVRLLMEKRKALIARKVKWWVAGISAFAILMLSLVNLWQDAKIQDILKRSKPGGGTAAERVEALEGYRNSLLAGFFSGEFRETADRILNCERVALYTKKMSELIDRCNREDFSSYVNRYMTLLEYFPPNSAEYQSLLSRLSDLKRRWDAECAGPRLEAMLKNSSTTPEAFRSAVSSMIFLDEDKDAWTRRFAERRQKTYEERRAEDVAAIDNAMPDPSAPSASVLSHVAELFASYASSYGDDAFADEPWRSIYKRVREISQLLRAATNAVDNGTELVGLASQLDAIPPCDGHDWGKRLASYLRSMAREAMEGSAEEALASLRADIEAHGLAFRFSRTLKHRLQRFLEKYRGTAQASMVRDFLKRLEAIEETGLLVRVEVSECPPGYHLRFWDHTTGSWNPMEVEPGISGTIRWKPGQSFKAGIEKTDPNNVGDDIIDVWEVDDELALIKVHEAGGQHVFGANFAVTITFPDLEQKLPKL